MRRNKPRRAVDMDITSLIDVMFMLIIFFVLTASFIQGKLDVALPDQDGKQPDPKPAITVTVTENGAVYWAGRSVSKEELASLAETAKKREVFIAGDRNASYGSVAEVLAILRGAGVESAGLLTQGGK